MIRVTLLGLLARGWRAVLTSLAAVVGVAVVAGTLLVGDTADRAGSTAELDLVRQIMLVAGGVAVLVGAFIVNLTMSVTVAQRTRELALLRCVGADNRQVRRSVLVEALIIGVLAAVAGLAAGYGVAAALRALINSGPLPGELPGRGFVLSARTVLAVFAVGCLTTVLSALAPARRAGRVAPVAALRDAAPPPGRLRVRRVVSGGLLLAAGLGALPVAVATDQGPLLFPAAALTLIGVRLVGPFVAGRLADGLGAPFRGVAGGLGRRNAARSPERTAATASALMIGLALLTLVNVLFASAERPMLDNGKRDRADFQVWTAGHDSGRSTPSDPAMVRRLRALPQLSAVVTIDCVDDAGRGGQICAADPGQFPHVRELNVVQGSLAAVTAGGVGVSEDQGRPVGSRMRIGGAELTVRAVYRRTGSFDDYLMRPADLARVGGEPYPVTALLRVAPDVAPGDARPAVVAAVSGLPAVEVHERSELHEQDLAQLGSARAVYRTLTGLATLVGLFGVVSTLALSIVERRRELGMLRAVGMQRRQVRSMIRVEGVIVALVGAAFGLAVGVAFGWAATRVLADSSLPTAFMLPVGTLAACVPLVAVAARIRQHGGAARVRSSVGTGVEVELRVAR